MYDVGVIGTSHDRLLAFVHRRGVLRTKDFVEFGVRRPLIRELVASGVIRREGRGLYTATAHDATEKHSFALACKRIPNGVVCLLSALVFHGLTTQNPWEVWMAIDFKAHKPILENPPLRIVRFSGDALRLGVETHTVEGVPVHVYSIAKTVADLFKYRNKIGIDVAIEALREARRSKHMAMTDLARFAQICRVSNVIRPYVESLQ